MKTSGAINRHRQQTALQRRQAESKSSPKRIALLPSEEQHKVRTTFDLIYHGLLTDPDRDTVDEDFGEEIDEFKKMPSPRGRKKKTV